MEIKRGFVVSCAGFCNVGYCAWAYMDEHEGWLGIQCIHWSFSMFSPSLFYPCHASLLKAHCLCPI